MQNSFKWPNWMIVNLLVGTIDGDVHDSVTISVACNKEFLQALHLYLNDRPNKGQGNHAAKKDADSGLLDYLNTEEVNNRGGSLLLPNMEIDFFLIRIGISKGLNDGGRQRNLEKNQYKNISLSKDSNTSFISNV